MAGENSRVNVTLGFKSDMSQINKDLDALTAKLRSIGQGKGILGGDQAITKEMNSAMNSASKLSTIMQKCRMDNGKLDVAALKEAMERTGMSAKSLAAEFKSLGPQGVAAFNEIAKAVQTAQVPMQKSQGLLREFGTTMKNTVKWQLSSTMLHGFMSAISGAYGYAQDLNESLNNIRIVSKQDTDQMAEFAKEANKAAKELSISTTAYTDAALIFYQQGLKGDDVTERTDVVAKMSNVTKDSVDEVSSYMTAIWNNFDDGSQSLEHYADVITGLGAATASSSAEIAAGLEKFAAVADTVGLSYDYATSALATVVAQTRQSADTVGTAFKTLFARIEGLKLGETLEDGVDLNKYSQALAKIGVSVLDANGQLRNMDDILDDMGSKWNQIGREQQVALAQTVAGTRQYNQLVALMDNWDKVQENLQVARSSDGELQSQADIYAQSWEAAQKRVQAAWQTIYASLMDEDFFISLANGAEKFLTIIGKIVDAMGGLKGMWPLLMMGITKLFSGDIGMNLGNFIVRFKAGLEEAKGVFKEFKEGFVQEDITLNVKVNNNAMAGVMEEYKKLISTITEAQQAIDKTDTVHQNLFNDILQRIMDAINAEVKAREALNESVNDHDRGVADVEKAISNAENNNNNNNDNNKNNTSANQEPQKENTFSNINQSVEETTNRIDELNNKINNSTINFQETTEQVENLGREIENVNGIAEELPPIDKTVFSGEVDQTGEVIENHFKEIQNDLENTNDLMVTTKNELVSTNTTFEQTHDQIAQNNTELAKTGEQLKEIEQGAISMQGEVPLLGTSIDENNRKLSETSEKFGEIGQKVQDVNTDTFNEGIQSVEESAQETGKAMQDIGSTVSDSVNPTIAALQKMLDSAKLQINDIVSIYKEMRNNSLGETFGEMGVEHFSEAIESLNTIIDEIEQAGEGAGVTKEQYKQLADIIEEIASGQAGLQEDIFDYVDGLKLGDKEAASLRDKINQIIKSSDDAATKAEQLAKAVADAKAAAKGASDAMKDLGNNTDQSKTKAEMYAQTFQTVTSNVSRFAMAITQVNNVIEQLNDDSKSLGEKLLSVAMAAGMIGMSFKGTMGFIGNISTGITKVIELTASLITGKTVELGISKAITREEEKQSQQGEIQSGQQTKINAKKGTQLVMRELGNGKSSFFPAEGKAAGTGFFGKLGSGITGIGGTAATGTAATIAGVAAVVVAAIAVGAIIAKIVHEVAKSNAARVAAKLSAEQTKKQEQVNKATEKAEATTSAQEEFHDLIKSGGSFDELRTSALKAAQATNDQTVAVLALKGSFEELDNYLTTKLLQDQKKQLETLNSATGSAESTIRAGMISAAYNSGSAVDKVNGKLNFDIYGLNYTDSEGEGSDDELKRLLDSVTGKDIKWGEVDVDDLTHALMGEAQNGMTSQEFLTELRNIVAMGGAGSKGAQAILDWANSDTVKTALEDYQKNLDQIQQVGLENAFTKTLVGKKEVESVKEYYEILKEIKKIAKDNGVDIDVEGFDEELNSIALSYAELQDQAMNAQSALAVAQELRPEIFSEDASALAKQEADNLLEDLANQIDQFNNSGKNYILLHPKFVADNLVDNEGNINLEPVKEIIDYQQNYNDYNTARSLTDDFDTKKGFSKDELAQIFDMGVSIAGSDDEVYQRLILREQELERILQQTESAAMHLSEEVQSSYNKLEEFDVIDTEDQISTDVATQAFAAGIDATGNNEQTTEDQLNQEIDNYITEYIKGVFDSSNPYDYSREHQDIYQKLTEEGIFDDDTQITKEGINGESVLNEEYIDGIKESVLSLIDAWDETTKSEKDFLKEMEKIDPMYKSMAKQIINVKKQSENFANTLEQVADATEIAEVKQKDIKQVLKDDQTQLALTSSQLDKMQAAYKTLHAAMEEYKEDGTMSLDTIQALLDAGPQYVQYLIDENGQLNINEESIRQATMAKYDYMEAQQAKIMLDQLEILTTYGVDSAQWQEVASAYASAEALTAAGNTMEAVAAKARKMAGEISGAKDELLNMASAADAFSKIFDAGRKGAATNFSKFMGVSGKKGGGGKKKEKEEKDLKEYADEFDRFYPLQKVIDDLADAISDLAKQQEHLAGGELVGSLHKQNKLLQQQKKAYQDLMKEQKLYQKEMQADLAKYGMSFEVASGNIANYAEATKAMLDEYNAAIEKYNKSAQEDADKKALEAVEKEYEKFKKLVSDYQGILTEIQDTENELDDIYYETIENNLKEFEIMVEVKLDIGEARRMVNDFVKEINKNFKALKKTTAEWLSVFDSALEQAKTYTEGDLGTINVDLDAYNKVKGIIDSGAYGHEGDMFVSETEAITKLKELGEQLKDDSMDLYNIWKDAWEEYIDAVDETLDQWDELMEGFDDINDELDHWERITELVRKAGDQENDYQVYLDIYDKKMQNEEQRQIALNRQIDALEREYKQLIESGASELDEDVQKIKEKMDEASKALYDSLETYLEAANNKYDKQFEYENKKSIEEALGFSIDEMTTQWERAKKASEGYYDENERIYQLDKINRKYAETINNTKDLKYKQKLAEMQETELEYLKNKKTLSEGDLEIAEKKLAVQQAQIALEEARDNKSTMRLQRDSQGNWSYQFAADENNIEDKKQALMDAAYEFYETVKKNEEESIESIRNIYNAWMEERQNLSRESFDSDAEYLAALEELDSYYKGLIEERVGTLNGYKQQQNQATATLLLASYVTNEENYANMTEAQKKLIDELKEHNIQDMADIVTATDEDYEAIRLKTEEVNKEAIAWWDELAKMCAIDTEQMARANEDFYNIVKGLIDDYNREVEAAREASRLAIDDVGSAVEDLGNKITDVADRVDDLVARTDQLSEFRERVNAIEDAWMSVKDSIMDALGALDEYMERLLDVREMQEEIKRNEVTGAEGFKGIDISSSGKGGGGGGTGGYSPSSSEDNSRNSSGPYEIVDFDFRKKSVNYEKLTSSYDIIPISSSGREGNSMGTFEVPHGTSLSGTDLKYAKEKYLRKWGGHIVSYKTGGYTGNWSDWTSEQDNGKLAWLHQKELILNAKDTQNILDAVELVRNMNNSNSEFIHYIADSIAAAAEQVVQTLEYGMHSVLDRVMYTSEVMASALHDQRETVIPDQNVHIEASFPNVQSSYEIETALNNLVNVASQRALYTEDLLLDY